MAVTKEQIVDAFAAGDGEDAPSAARDAIAAELAPLFNDGGGSSGTVGPDLTAIEDLTGTGYLRRDGDGIWSLHTLGISDISGLQAVLDQKLTTVTGDLTSRAANTVYAAPSGVSGTAAFRSLVAADIPSLDASKITTGTLGYARGGTGISAPGASAGNLRWNGSAYTIDTASYALASAIPVASSTTPSPLGTAAVGTGTTWARADHVHAMPTAAQVGAEPALGSPGTSGWVLSSTTAGVRSWVAFPAAPVSSVFGRTGAVVATSGDYTTSLVTEATNLYFTTARAQAAISATSPLSYSAGVVSHLSTDGNLHVPATSTTNNGKALLAGSTAGSISWMQLTTSHISGLTGWATKAYTNGSTTDVAEGTKLYFTEARVRATPLTGYSVGTNTALAATDTVLGALQKVQGQINARLTGNQSITLSGDASGTGSTSIAVTLSSVITAGGPTGNGTTVPVITYDAKGRLTAVTTATITPAAIGASSTSHDHAHLSMGTSLEGSGDAFSSRGSYDGRGGVRTGTANGPFGNIWYNIVDVRHRNAWTGGDIWGGELIWGMTGSQYRLAFRSRDASGVPTSWTEAWTNSNLSNPVSGTGVNGRVPYWNGSNTQTSSDRLTFDGVSRITLGNIGAAGGLIMKRASDGSETAYIGYAGVTGGDTWFLYQLTGGSQAHVWQTNNGTNIADRMTLNAAGNLTLFGASANYYLNNGSGISVAINDGAIYLRPHTGTAYAWARMRQNGVGSLLFDNSDSTMISVVTNGSHSIRYANSTSSLVTALSIGESRVSNPSSGNGVSFDFSLDSSQTVKGRISSLINAYSSREADMAFSTYGTASLQEHLRLRAYDKSVWVYGLLAPGTGDSHDLGGSGNRWNSIYAKNFVIPCVDATDSSTAVLPVGVPNGSIRIYGGDAGLTTQRINAPSGVAIGYRDSSGTYVNTAAGGYITSNHRTLILVKWSDTLWRVIGEMY